MAGIRPLRQGEREGDADVRRQQFPGTKSYINFDCKNSVSHFLTERMTGQILLHFDVLGNLKVDT